MSHEDPIAAGVSPEGELPTRVRNLVRLLGGHPSRRLGLDLQDSNDAPLGRWLLASSLITRIGEIQALTAFAELQRRGLSSPERVAGAEPAAIAALLESVGLRRAGPAAQVLVRASGTLCRDYLGSFDRLAAASESLEDLAARISGLSPGIGRAVVARFLRPLRERWTLGEETPFEAAAVAAGRHMGLFDEADDIEGAPGKLRARLFSGGDWPPFCDVEAALERLGAAACARERVQRCPLRDACPLRAAHPGEGL